jgi:amino acid transporter
MVTLIRYCYAGLAFVIAVFLGFIASSIFATFGFLAAVISFCVCYYFTFKYAKTRWSNAHPNAKPLSIKASILGGILYAITGSFLFWAFVIYLALVKTGVIDDIVDEVKNASSTIKKAISSEDVHAQNKES